MGSALANVLRIGNGFLHSGVGSRIGEWVRARIRGMGRVAAWQWRVECRFCERIWVTSNLRRGNFGCSVVFHVWAADD
jgi:hypothetical protein